MIGARGCIEEIQKADARRASARPGIYRITVAWQGMHQTVAPSVACARNLFGADTYRRTLSAIQAGLSGCQ